MTGAHHDEEEADAQPRRNDGVLSARATRVGLLVAVPLVLVLGVQTISWVAPKLWPRGEPLTADALDHDFGPLDDAIATPNQPNPWAACGVFEDLGNGTARCEVNGYPVDQYEYGFRYNGKEIHAAECVQSSVGIRIVDRYPYMASSDDPASGAMQLGGAKSHTETDASDDDVPGACPATIWRPRYWPLVSGNVVLDIAGNGCANEPIYCRRR